MSSIRSTIIATLTDAGHGHYGADAEGVISVLEDREAQIVDALSTIAAHKGLSEAETRAILEATGLLEPEPEPEPEVEEVEGEEESTGLAGFALGDLPPAAREIAGQVLAEVRSLRAEVGALRAAAQRHGVSV